MTPSISLWTFFSAPLIPEEQEGLLDYEIEGSRRYVQGAVHMRIQDTTLIDGSKHDYPEHLWRLLILALEELMQKSEVHTSFPDQPIPIAFIRLSNNRLRISVGETSISTDAPILVKEIVKEIGEFFKALHVLYPEKLAANMHVYHRIDRLLAHFTN